MRWSHASHVPREQQKEPCKQQIKGFIVLIHIQLSHGSIYPKLISQFYIRFCTSIPINYVATAVETILTYKTWDDGLSVNCQHRYTGKRKHTKGLLQSAAVHFWATSSNLGSEKKGKCTYINSVQLWLRTQVPHATLAGLSDFLKLDQSTHSWSSVKTQPLNQKGNNHKYHWLTHLWIGTLGKMWGLHHHRVSGAWRSPLPRPSHTLSPHPRAPQQPYRGTTISYAELHFILSHNQCIIWEWHTHQYTFKKASAESDFIYD